MNRDLSERHGRVEDLQSHARSLGLEMQVAEISYDTLVRKIGEQTLSDAWEVPETPSNSALPAITRFALTAEGLFVNTGPTEHFVGREVRIIDHRDVLPPQLARSLRQRLYDMEKRHDIFNKLENRDPERKKPA
jgi:hypothetical protein